jgi:hypothetical protein
MTPTVKHTPTPWFIARTSVGGAKVTIKPESQRNVSGTPICTVNRNRAEVDANAAFIVLAVNHHEELVAALQNMIGMWEFIDPAVGQHFSPKCAVTVKHAKDLLAKLGGAK